jgi:drug/metabolite transporter (DMT)-like permease
MLYIVSYGRLDAVMRLVYLSRGQPEVVLQVSKGRRRTVALLALMGGVVILGFAAIFVTWSGAPGPVTGLYRMVIGAAVITPFFLLNRRAPLKSLRRRGVLMALLGGVLFGADMAIWMTAVSMGGATMPTLMANTAPLWVGVGSILLFKERQSVGFWVGLPVAVAGVVMVFGHNLGHEAGPGRGMVMGLVAALFYAGFVLATQEGRTYLDTLTYLWISTLGAAAALAVINLLLGTRLAGYDARTYLSFFALGVIVQFLGWLLINYAQGYLRASLVAPVLLGQPVLTALLAVPLLKESLTPWLIAGGLTVLAGIYIVVWSRNRALRRS